MNETKNDVWTEIYSGERPAGRCPVCGGLVFFDHLNSYRVWVYKCCDCRTLINGEFALRDIDSPYRDPGAAKDQKHCLRCGKWREDVEFRYQPGPYGGMVETCCQECWDELQHEADVSVAWLFLPIFIITILITIIIYLTEVFG